MQVTPVNRKFGKYAPGDVFELRDKTAKVLIKVGKLAEAPSKSQRYLTRDMRAEHPQAQAVIVETHEATVVADPVVEDAAEEAPYGYKADGTPRKRPGRQAGHE